MTTAYQGPDHLSVSQIHSIQDCPWHWFLERVARVPQLPSWWLVGGKAFHSATEVIDHTVENGPWITDYDLLNELFTAHFDVEVQDQVDKNPEFPPETWRAAGRASKQWPNKEDETFWRTMGPTWLMNWVNWRINNPAWEVAQIGGVPAIEAEIGGAVGTAQLPLVGYIDRVFFNPSTKEYMVLDLKTGSRTPTDTLQLGTYSLMLDLMFGIRPRWGVFWMARTGTTTTPVDLHAEWSHNRLEHEVQGAESIIKANHLSCNVGGFCAFSSTAQYCYACTGIKPDTILPWEVEVVLPSVPAPATVLTSGSDPLTQGETVA